MLTFTSAFVWSECEPTRYRSNFSGPQTWSPAATSVAAFCPDSRGINPELWSLKGDYGVYPPHLQVGRRCRVKNASRGTRAAAVLGMHQRDAPKEVTSSSGSRCGAGGLWDAGRCRKMPPGELAVYIANCSCLCSCSPREGRQDQAVAG